MESLIANVTIGDSWGAALVASYAFLGGGIKYIDQAFDEGMFNKKIAYVIAAMCGTLLGFLSAFDSLTATIALALVISLAVMKKIDNVAFILGAVLVVGIPAVTTQSLLNINWIGLAALTLSSIGDEAVNFIADKYPDNGIATILHFRPLMKAAMLVLVIYEVFPTVYLVAFIAFDVCYPSVEYLSVRRSRKALPDSGGK